MAPAVAMATVEETEGAAPMSDRLTVILPPVLSVEEKEQQAIQLCCVARIKGDGWGDGSISDYGDSMGSGRSMDYDNDCYDCGDGYGYGSGDGDGGSSDDV